MVAYLEGIGYTGESGAFAMSLIFAFAALGKVLMGFLADRVSARIALALDFAMIAVGLTLVFGAARVAVIAVFVVAFATLAGAPLILLPLLVAESLGRKRYGLLEAMTGVAATFGAMVGPVIAGRILDLTGRYTVAFELFIVINVIGALAVFTCQSYSTENSKDEDRAGRCLSLIRDHRICNGEFGEQATDHQARQSAAATPPTSID